MSKERLEEFREFIDFMYESIDIEDHQRFVAISDSLLKDGWFRWIYQYAKEQAERVEELEEELNGAEHRYGYKQMYKICNRDYATLNSEKNRYKQALEFYADENNYDYKVEPDSVGDVDDETFMVIYEVDSEIITDGGYKARQALKGRRGRIRGIKA